MKELLVYRGFLGVRIGLLPSGHTWEQGRLPGVGWQCCPCHWARRPGQGTCPSEPSCPLLCSLFPFLPRYTACSHRATEPRGNRRTVGLTIAQKVVACKFCFLYDTPEHFLHTHIKECDLVLALRWSSSCRGWTHTCTHAHTSQEENKSSPELCVLKRNSVKCKGMARIAPMATGKRKDANGQ